MKSHHWGITIIILYYYTIIIIILSYNNYIINILLCINNITGEPITESISSCQFRHITHYTCMAVQALHIPTTVSGRTPTNIAMVSSSLTSSRAPISAHVTLGTVAKPSLLAEGWTEDRATMKSFNSMHSPLSCSSERGSWFLSNPSSLCNSSLKETNEGKTEKRQSLLKKILFTLLNILSATFL